MGEASSVCVCVRVCVGVCVRGRVCVWAWVVGEAGFVYAQVGTTWQWHDNGELSTRTAPVPAVRVNPRTGKKVFFNSVVAAYTGWVGE